MTNNFYPLITPTAELVKQWCYEDGDEVAASPRWFHIVCTKAARWGADQQLDLDAEQINKAYQAGADQELEACINYFHEYDPSWGEASELITGLRAARRPKPQSQAEEALIALEQTVTLLMPVTGSKKIERFDTIRAALKRLRELERTVTD